MTIYTYTAAQDAQNRAMKYEEHEKTQFHRKS